MAEEASYRDGSRALILSPETAARSGAALKAGRRLTPAELHEQRVAWGNKWGKLVSDAVREALGKGE